MESLAMKQTTHTLHSNIRTGEIRKSKNDVLKIIEGFGNFLNPFALPNEYNDALFYLSSGKAVRDSVAGYLLKYVDKEEEATKVFIEERLVKRAVPFHGCMTKLKLKHFTFGAVQKSSQQLNRRL